MADVTLRTPPPPLIPRDPECPLCREDLGHFGDGFACPRCRATWPDTHIGDESGEWDEPAAEQCTATVQPNLDSAWIKVDDPRKHRTYRCVLAADHIREDPVVHADPEMIAWVKGWR